MKQSVVFLFFEMSITAKTRFTFPGGIHPPQYKDLTLNNPVQPGPASKQVSVMLSQHIGALCKPLVSKGAVVQAGEKIGDVDAFVSAPVHSPINGKVKEIALVSHPVLGRCPAVVIEQLQHNPTRAPKINSDFKLNEDEYSVEQICKAVREAGIVGMGGAGFPTRVKIEPNPRLPKKTMIVNGCECEPYITCDYRLMIEQPGRIITGIKLAKKAAGCSNVFIGIEDNKPQAIEVITKALENHKNTDGITPVPLKTKYPQGEERQLINAVLKKQVPTGSIPPAIGVLVLNTATVAAIAQTIAYGTPLTSRIITVTGQAVARPGNYCVHIGTSVEELIEFCGGITKKSAKVLLGGPMMGIAIADLKTPILKTTGAVTILTEKQIGRAKFDGRQTACIRCGRCLQACPEHLNPTKIAHAVKNNALELAESYYIDACTECGCCSYVCPANIELAGYIKTGKIFVAKQKKQMSQ